MHHYAQLPNGRYLGKIQTNIMRTCRRRAVGYDRLEAVTGSNRGSLHVQVSRLVNDGLLEVDNFGTSKVKFQSTAMPRVLKTEASQ